MDDTAVMWDVPAPTTPGAAGDGGICQRTPAGSKATAARGRSPRVYSDTVVFGIGQMGAALFSCSHGADSFAHDVG